MEGRRSGLNGQPADCELRGGSDLRFLSLYYIASSPPRWSTIIIDNKIPLSPSEKRVLRCLCSAVFYDLLLPRF